MPSPVNNTQYVVFTNLFCLSFFNSHSQTSYKYSFSHHYVLKLFYKIFCWHWESIFIFTSFSSVNIASDLINVSKCNICKYALSKTIGSRFIFVVVLICLHLSLFKNTSKKSCLGGIQRIQEKTFEKFKLLL